MPWPGLSTVWHKSDKIRGVVKSSAADFIFILLFFCCTFGVVVAVK